MAKPALDKNMQKLVKATPTQDNPMNKAAKGKKTVTKGPSGLGNGSGNTY